MKNPAARNVDEIAALERESDRTVRSGERVSLALAQAAGTPLCALLHLAFVGN